MYSKEDYEHFKPIRNKIRKYPKLEVIKACIKAIRYAESDPKRLYSMYPPWLLLLVVKWTIIEGDKYGHCPAQPFSKKEMFGIIRMIGDLDDIYEKSRDEAGWLMYLRKLAYQQFPLQQSAYQASFARQSLLFGRLAPDAELRKMFVNEVGLEIDDFIELELMLLCRFFVNHDEFISAEWFSTVESQYAEGTGEKFLKCLSLDIPGASQFLTRDWQDHPPEIRYELFEMSPLKRKPLLEIDKRYYCYSANLLYRGLESYIHDTLRQIDPQVFGDEFGTGRFEEYVGEAARHSGLPVVTEEQLKDTLPNVRVIDYLIVDRDVNIFVDAKAIEVTYIGEVSEDPEIIINRVQSSVVRAIQQAFKLVENLQTIKSIGGVELGQSDERYLLVVTHGDTYLGSGRDFYSLIATDVLNGILAESNGTQWIPFENMYFVSLEDFDTFMHAVHQGRMGMAEALRRAVSDDATGMNEKRKFTFRQHLFEMLGDIDLPTYLDDEFHRIAERTASKCT